MTEELVTLETAKLLKEKGFQQRKYFINVSTLHHCYKYLSVPPQSIAQKWLRENHSIHIAVDFNQYGRWYYRLYDIEDYDFLSETEVDKIYKSYEEALEAGIEEALKHI
ncbi:MULTISPECIES: hypothetical protein [Bacteroides]|uniref:hypothetical protein n=1 Tax=Bacteroides TaxID=816 RepID=UPI0018A09A15|nr:hypothetical protein [Bacteroides stercoris]